MGQRVVQLSRHLLQRQPRILQRPHRPHALQNVRGSCTACARIGKSGLDLQPNTHSGLNSLYGFHIHLRPNGSDGDLRLWMNDFQVIRAEEYFRRLRPADMIERNQVRMNS
jgi:hypothetical protein